MALTQQDQLWESAKHFLAGLRRHALYFIPAALVLPFEIYEYVARPALGTESWPERIVVPGSAFPWIFLATFVWIAFLTYHDLRITIRPEIEEIDTESIMQICRDNVSTHSDVLLKDHIGKTIKVAGAVFGTHYYKNRSISVTITDKNNRLFFCIFSRRWKDRISLLRKGDELEIIGKISKVNEFNMTLLNCQIPPALSLIKTGATA